jgi:hypothetical protein
MLRTPHLATRRSNAYNLRLIPKQLDTIKHGMCFISTPTEIFMAKPKKNLIQRRKKKRESSDEVDHLGQTGPHDDELV